MWKMGRGSNTYVRAWNREAVSGNQTVILLCLSLERQPSGLILQSQSVGQVCNALMRMSTLARMDATQMLRARWLIQSAERAHAEPVACIERVTSFGAIRHPNLTALAPLFCTYRTASDARRPRLHVPHPAARLTAEIKSKRMRIYCITGARSARLLLFMPAVDCFRNLPFARVTSNATIRR